MHIYAGYAAMLYVSVLLISNQRPFSLFVCEMEIEHATANESGVTDYEMRVSKEREKRGMYLVWEDLTVVVPNFGNGHTRRLLNGLSGYAEPNRIMAIMGPSGSGKSTLLDALAGLYFSLLVRVRVHV